LRAVISPLLSNLYLHHFDAALTRAHLALTRYADDFIVQGATRAEVEEAQRFVAWGLQRLQLQLQPRKTRLTHFDEGFDFLGIHFKGNQLSYVAHHKKIV
jgi:retron-type reverse transcriptase